MCFFPTFAASFGFRLTLLFAMNAYYYPDFQSFQKSLWFIDRALLVLGSYIHRPSGKRWDVSSNSSYYMTMSMSYVHQKTKGQDETKKVSRVWPELYMIKSMKQEKLFRNSLLSANSTKNIKSVKMQSNVTHPSNWGCNFVSISHSWRSLSKKILKDDKFQNNLLSVPYPIICDSRYNSTYIDLP